MKYRFLHAFSILLLAFAGQSASAAISAGMSADEMIADIVSGMESGATCAETKAAITTAVELDNDHAPALVAALAARKDTGCYDDVWLAQRVADRIESPYNDGALLYAEEACLGAFSVVQAAVAGLDERNQPVPDSPEEQEALAAALAQKMFGIIEQANRAMGGDTATGNSCAEEILVGAAAAIGDPNLKNLTWNTLVSQFDASSELAWVAESLAFLGSYPPEIFLMTRSLRTVHSPACTDPLSCGGDGDSSDEPDPPPPASPN